MTTSMLELKDIMIKAGVNEDIAKKAIDMVASHNMYVQSARFDTDSPCWRCVSCKVIKETFDSPSETYCEDDCNAFGTEHGCWRFEEVDSYEYY